MSMRRTDKEFFEQIRALIDANLHYGRITLCPEDFDLLMCWAYQTKTINQTQMHCSMDITQATMLLGMAKRNLVETVARRLKA